VARLRVGKGQAIALNHDVLFAGMFDPRTEVAAAIEMYDERVGAAFGGLAAALGAYVGPVGPLTSTWPVIVWGSLMNQPALDSPLLRQALRDWNPFFPMLADLQAVVPAAFLPGSGGLTAEAQAVAVFLKALRRPRHGPQCGAAVLP
jgi:hypothetical protein